jgi:hypothetical protein
MNRKAMKKMRRVVLLILITCTYLNGISQNNLVVEQIQVYSSLNPNATYWQLPTNINPILAALDKGYFSELNLQREKNYPLVQKTLTKLNQMGKIVIDWKNSSTIPYHAYLELYEVSADFAYKNNLVDIPLNKRDSVHSFWLIGCSIFNQEKEKVNAKNILLGLLPIQSLGMGYTITTSAGVPTSIYQAVIKGISLLSINSGELDYIEAKMPMAYAIDNYWMPLIHNQPRTIIDTAKGFLSFTKEDGNHLLRIPNAVLNKINTRDRTTNNPFSDIVTYIKKNRSNTNSNEYYQVIQALRDVTNNIDYTIKGYIEFDNIGLKNEWETSNAIVFLPDSMHTIYQGNDSVGNFSVKENVIEKNKSYNPNIIYNGYDSTKQYALNTFFATQPIIHSRIIEGKIKNHSFTIQLNYENNINTILLDNKIVLVTGGQKKPVQMVAAQNSADPILLDLLLLMASSEIFQYPS